ncbi:MAG TPA: winged helix-turn-helix domain-containing protein [Terracidiphilus sp.]|nr:winged helix-turn-helix domain-containing protein [Terracidiphilus sp.]
MSASQSGSTKELYEFGPFRVDAEKEIVVRAGEPVPLTPKTFQILLVLIRKNREVVTKDDLMKSVWPDTFVEEANLSRNIFLLRKALGEAAQDHRYIVTVPGRGYRLAESVRMIPEQELSVVAASHTRMQVEVKDTKPWRWVATIAALVIVASGFGLYRYFSQRRARLSATDTVVLADFNNSTRDPVFDETLRRGLAIQLEQSPFLSIIPDQRVQHVLRLMGQSPDTRLTGEIARGICERTGSAAVLEGSIAPIGSQYVVGLKATACRDGKVLDLEQVQAANKEEVLSALSHVARRFRKRVGESLNTIQEHDTPLDEATTPSLEALEAYSAGWKLHRTTGTMAALPLLKRAVEIDPNFAIAHATLGREYANIEEFDHAAESTSRGWQLRDHASDPEKFFIAATYQILATGNLELARQTCEAWARAYPRDATPRTMLAGFPNKASGRYEQAIAWAQQAVELNPDFAIAYYNLAVDNFYMGRIEEAENTLRRAAGRALQIDEYLMLEYDIAFLKNDKTAMDQVVGRARERSGAEAWIANRQASTLGYLGQMRQARVLFQRSVDLDMQQALRERAALWDAGESLREARFGNAPEAIRRANAALNLSNNTEVVYGAALALAVARDSRAEALAEGMERNFPENSVVRFSYLPVLRARIALNHGDAAKAIEALQVAVPYELGVSHDLIGALYPIYVRGEAYLAARKGAEASVEFQKILDHREIAGSDPIGALAHLQLGRAFAVAGDPVKAKAAYEDFFNLWREADTEIPVLKKARAEYQSLRQVPAIM